MKKEKQVSRKSLVELSVMLGQMTHCKSAIITGIRYRIVDDIVFKGWEEYIEEIIKNET